MSSPSAEAIADIVLGRRQVYGLDVDSKIRQAANRLTARALFEIIERLDGQDADFPTRLSDLLAEFGGEDASHLIGFDTGAIPSADQEIEATPHAEKSEEFYLRLVFRNEEAAYYQFSLFPNFHAEYVLAAERKRTGAVQHLRLELSRPEALQSFIESCRSNPHLERVEESAAAEFERAPSDAI